MFEKRVFTDVVKLKRSHVGMGRTLTQGRQPSRESRKGCPGGPVAKTPQSQCRGPRFDPRSGN